MGCLVTVRRLWRLSLAHSQHAAEQKLRFKGRITFLEKEVMTNGHFVRSGSPVSGQDGY